MGQPAASVPLSADHVILTVSSGDQSEGRFYSQTSPQLSRQANDHVTGLHGWEYSADADANDSKKLMTRSCASPSRSLPLFSGS